MGGLLQRAEKKEREMISTNTVITRLVEPKNQIEDHKKIFGNNIFNAIFFPLAGSFPSGLRAAGDVKFTMYTSIFTTVICRVALSVVFAVWMDMGVIGIACAMCADWAIKSVILLLRYRSGKWKKHKVI